ncbi:hypothetical protein ACJMK2_005968 [Sinanodonta woodiana]|uniref:Methyltransferase domain-containing protein n=1 Tax=Sinanodonta woodiana TaxID=1069815 RepID=A0ABD3VS43_SINWO
MELNLFSVELCSRQFTRLHEMPTAELSYKEYTEKFGEMTEDAQTYFANFAAHRPGITREEVVDQYTKWSETYDQDLCSSGRYHGPKIAADAVAEEFKDGRESIKILDIGAGTGNFGKEAYKHGFRELHGIDPSSGMLERCQEKNIYKKLLCDFFQRDTPGFENDEYDCTVVAGAMGEGHLSCDCLYEMIRVVKPGGLVVIVMRKEYLDYVKEYKDRLEPLMDQLETERKWQKISRKIVPNYSFNKEGVVYKFRRE